MQDRDFPGAARAFCTVLPRTWAQLAEAGLPIDDAGAFAFAAFAIAQDDALTEARLSELAVMNDLASRSRVRVMIDRFVARGLIARADPDGHRAHRLIVTPALLAAMGHWLRGIATPVVPWSGIAVADIDDETVRDYMRSQTTAYRRGFVLFDRFPAVASLMHRRAGYALLLTLLRLHLTHAGGLLHFNRSRFAAAGGFSRAHVATLIGDAKRAGWLTLGGDDLLMLAPAFADEGTRWIATEIAWSARCLRAPLA